DKYTKEVANLLTARLTILEGKSQAFEPASLLPHIEGEITQKLTTLYIGSKKTKAWDALLDVRELKQDSIEVLLIKENEGICLEKSEIAPDSSPAPAKFNLKLGPKCDTTNAYAVQLVLSYFPKME